MFKNGLAPVSLELPARFHQSKQNLSPRQFRG